MPIPSLFSPGLRFKADPQWHSKPEFCPVLFVVHCYESVKMEKMCFHAFIISMKAGFQRYYDEMRKKCAVAFISISLEMFGPSRLCSLARGSNIKAKDKTKFQFILGIINAFFFFLP